MLSSQARNDGVRRGRYHRRWCWRWCCRCHCRDARPCVSTIRTTAQTPETPP